MKRFAILFCVMAIWMALAIGCKKNVADTPPAEIVLELPANFPFPVYQFDNNKLTQAGFDLGRRLFFEKALSVNNTISCGSCHQPFAAFANLDKPVSNGINNCAGTRNAFPLFNLAWQHDFMWDGGVNNIETSGLNALTTTCEMGNTLDNIVKTLQAHPAYPELFKKAFGTTEINSQKLFRALTQFTSLLVSANSRYDKYKRKEAGASFTQAENEGYLLFIQHCANCHAEPLFTDGSFRSNGLDEFPADNGRELITKLKEDKGKFKVPSLRNVELTRPYMHDGRFYSLEAVMEHYTNGVRNHANLDPELNKNTSPGLRLTTAEQSKIIAFLKTLTDNEFVNDKRFTAL